MDVSKLPDVFVTTDDFGNNATLIKRKSESDSWTMYHLKDNKWRVSFFLNTEQINSYLRGHAESTIFVPYASDKVTQVLGQALGLPNRQEELLSYPVFLAVCEATFGGLMACSQERYAAALRYIAEQLNVEVDTDLKQAVSRVISTMENCLD